MSDPEKRIYQTPTVIDFGDLARGHGDCLNGAGDQTGNCKNGSAPRENCQNGNRAGWDDGTTSNCQTGNVADAQCDTGNVAYIQCSTGNSGNN